MAASTASAGDTSILIGPLGTTQADSAVGTSFLRFLAAAAVMGAARSNGNPSSRTLFIIYK